LSSQFHPGKIFYSALICISLFFVEDVFGSYTEYYNSTFPEKIELFALPKTVLQYGDIGIKSGKYIFIINRKEYIYSLLKTVEFYPRERVRDRQNMIRNAIFAHSQFVLGGLIIMGDPLPDIVKMAIILASRNQPMKILRADSCHNIPASASYSGVGKSKSLLITDNTSLDTILNLPLNLFEYRLRD